MKYPQVMIGTLFSNEADMPYCNASVLQQTYTCSHIVFSGLGEVAAHKQLYRTFANSDFDYLIKLDADMVFNNSECVQTMVDAIRGTGLWRITFLADDYFTGQEIQGIHIYSRKVKWWYSQFVENDLRSDRVDNIHRPEWWRKLIPFQPLRTKLIEKTIVKHAHSANEFQGFSFAVRRVFKRSQHLLPAFENYLENDTPALRGVCRGIMAGAQTKRCELKNMRKLYEEYKDKRIEPEYIRGIVEQFAGDMD